MHTTVRFVLLATITIAAACGSTAPVTCGDDEVLGDDCGLGCYDRPPSCLDIDDDALCACLAAACADNSDEACSAEAADIALRAREPDFGTCELNADDVVVVRFATVDGCF
ncbi:MAG TPA: hypothetical protein VGF99_05350 [Myxococcota bacterium]